MHGTLLLVPIRTALLDRLTAVDSDSDVNMAVGRKVPTANTARLQSFVRIPPTSPFY